MSVRVTPLAFLTEISRRGAAANVQLVEDPLRIALLAVDRAPATGEARLLIRLLNALANDVGEFSMAELMLFDAHWLTVAVTLIDARQAGVYTQRQWTQAARTADWRLRAIEALAQWRPMYK
jgi:aromatic ring-opening dioxygenase catalytic subunit (LigB family)